MRSLHIKYPVVNVIIFNLTPTTAAHQLTISAILFSSKMKTFETFWNSCQEWALLIQFRSKSCWEFIASHFYHSGPVWAGYLVFEKGVGEKLVYFIPTTSQIVDYFLWPLKEECINKSANGTVWHYQMAVCVSFDNFKVKLLDPTRDGFRPKLISNNQK